MTQSEKTQPWKAVWPAPEADTSKAVQMAKDAIPLNGAYGYNDKGEGVAPEEKGKSQPWKAVWPAPEAGASKAAQMAKDAIPLNGAYGYNDKGEGVAPEKK